MQISVGFCPDREESLFLKWSHFDADFFRPCSRRMPPTSKTIFEEGAQIISFKIINKGVYQREQLVRYLVDEPAKFEGCSGTRCFNDVESDLKAQIAANLKGARLIFAMVEEYSLSVVQDYMIHVSSEVVFFFCHRMTWELINFVEQIRDNAELAVRNLLRKVASERGNNLHAIDYLDDGTPIELRVTINEVEGSAVFDFEGTGPEIYGNLNAPVSVSYSAIIYCLRAMVDQDIPLNQGCLVPITVLLPIGSCLNPSPSCGVVGGNVCTSQRVTDVVLLAFQAAAASQGDCTSPFYMIRKEVNSWRFFSLWLNRQQLYAPLCCPSISRISSLTFLFAHVKVTFGTGGKNAAGENIPGFGYYETIAGGSGAGPTWEGTSGGNVFVDHPKLHRLTYSPIQQFTPT